jgi:hypothetical protein
MYIPTRTECSALGFVAGLVVACIVMYLTLVA